MEHSFLKQAVNGSQAIDLDKLRLKLEAYDIALSRLADKYVDLCERVDELEELIDHKLERSQKIIEGVQDARKHH